MPREAAVHSTRFTAGPTRRAGHGARALAFWIAAAGSLAAPPLAHATPPGGNGPIVFSSNGEIYTIAPDGTALTQVHRPLEDEKTDFLPAWAPDGGRIVTGGQVLGPDTGVGRHWSDTNLHLFAPDGSGFSRQSTPNQHWSTAPAWSPDGTRIAYSSDVFGNSSIYSVRPDGSDPRFLTGGASESESFDPAWSPDGQHIVFSRIVDTYDSTDLFTMRADGTDVRRLLERPGIERTPSWSPDGKWIAFSGTGPRVDDGASWSFPGSDVYVVPAGGGAPVRLTETGENGAPAWAPQGNAIVFQSDRHAPPGTSQPDLYVMDPSGAAERRLTWIGCWQCEPDWAPLPGSAPFGPGTGTTQQPGSSKPGAMRIRRLKIVPRRFEWSAARRVRVSFVASRPGRLRFALSRAGRRPSAAARRQVTRRARAGVNRFRLGRMFPRRLRPGRYRLTIASPNGAVRAQASFRVRAPAG